MKNMTKKRNFRKNITMLIFSIVMFFLFSCKIYSNDKVSSHFSPLTFKNPSPQYGPFTRWWWPGTDVENEELKREIEMFVKYGFAGVEIHPNGTGLNPNSSKEQEQKQFNWGSDKFYDHLKYTLEEARINGLIVDLNAGAGSPLGGPMVKPESSIQTLDYVDTLVVGGKEITFNIPKLKQKKYTFKKESLNGSIKQSVSIDYAKLQSVIVAEFKETIKGSSILDRNSIHVFNIKGNDGKLTWLFPEGNWKIIAFYSMPDGEYPKGVALKEKGFVADAFDSTKVLPIYEYILGDSIGITEYYKNPLRAVFNDSYEFMPDRHFSDIFMSEFKKNRGYDIEVALPVNIKYSYNNAYFAPFSMTAPFKFSYGEEDWRMVYDYNLTVSDLFIDQFLLTSNQWLNDRGLSHRNQAYGLRSDIIRTSGSVNIPEAETLAGDNLQAFRKLITSGSHLYNRQITSQESFVFRGMAETTTPQKIKLLADKSFAFGINQIFYHGTPYKYQTGEYGEDGWKIFSNPFEPGNLFSDAFNETYPFWEDLKEVNKYIARSQYLLQSGKPFSDVIIYFPFIDFMPENITPNPKEILVQGRWEGVEPEIPLGIPSVPDDKNIIRDWFRDIWPIINKLDENGITWDFVNDHSLLEAKTISEGDIDIRGNHYKALFMANLPYVEKNTAKKIVDLSSQGSKIMFIGELPEKQPSYLNYEKNDVIVKEQIKSSLENNNTIHKKKDIEVFEWIDKLPVNLKYDNEFVKTINRILENGSMVKFFWNQGDSIQNLKISRSSNYKYYYWLNPETGEIIQADAGNLNYTLFSYGSIFLLASQQKIKPDTNTTKSTKPYSKCLVLEKWDIKTDKLQLNEVELFDWRDNEEFKYNSDKTTYTHSFDLKDYDRKKKYIFNLGDVYWTVKIYVNGELAGNKIWRPYTIDVSRFLKPGKNELKLEIQSTKRNEYIGEAEKGNKLYPQFKNKENTLLPSGLLGPVKLESY